MARFVPSASPPAHSLRVRLLAALALMLLPLVAVGVAGIIALEHSARAAADIGDEVVEEVRLIGLTTDQLRAVEDAAMAALYRRDRGARRRFVASSAQLDLQFRRLREFDEPEERGLAGVAERRWRRAHATATRALWGPPGRGGWYPLAALHDEVSEARAMLARLRTAGLEEIRIESRMIEDHQARQVVVLLAVLALGLLAALLLARSLRRLIEEPLHELRRVARRIGGGDLSERVRLRRQDEFHQVADAFNAMAERLVESRRQLAHRAFHDELTELPNRALFLEHTGQALARRKAPNAAGRLAVLFVDLDDFKAVNDGLGHAAGDELLIQVGRRLRTWLRPTDLVARLGGDEFGVLLEDLAGEAEAASAAERLRLALAVPLSVAGRELRVRASVGIAVATPEVTADDLMRDADVAMYAAKGDGKDAQRAYDPRMHATMLDRLALEQDLRGALERRELTLAYEPIVRLDSGAVTGMEALLRWRHARRGAVSPAEFVPVAERTGLIVPLGRWVLEQACARAVAVNERHPELPALSMSVNVSLGQLRDPSFVDMVAETLARTGLAGDRLVLEITESLLMTDVAATVSTLSALRERGVRIAVDDFGTGYSSLSYLRHFPIDILKIDRTFVDSVAEAQSADETLVRAIIGLGRTLGLATVAEGIERAEQRAELAALGCELGQGYHFARPLDPEALEAFLAESSAGALVGVGV
jgi:diguanylate cyclase (GGDEF)-like protein